MFLKCSLKKKGKKCRCKLAVVEGYRFFSLSLHPLLPLGFSCSSRRFFFDLFWMCEEVTWLWNSHLWRNWAAVWKSFLFVFHFSLLPPPGTTAFQTKKLEWLLLNRRWFWSSAACATALAVSVACFILKKKKKSVLTGAWKHWHALFHHTNSRKSHPRCG